MWGSAWQRIGQSTIGLDPQGGHGATTADQVEGEMDLL